MCCFAGLVVEAAHQEQIYNGGFDGMYTYFASNTFVYGSTPSNWNKISGYCKNRQLLFAPSIGPGYIDTEVSEFTFAQAAITSISVLLSPVIYCFLLLSRAQL